MKKIIEAQYAEELKHIEKFGKLPEWNMEQVIKIGSFRCSCDVEFVMTNNAMVFLRSDKETYLPLKHFAENKFVRAFLLGQNNFAKNIIVILSKNKMNLCLYKISEIDKETPIRLCLAGDTVIKEPVLSARTGARALRRYFSLNVNVDELFSKIGDVMEFVNEVKYIDNFNVWEMSGINPKTSMVEKFYFRQDENFRLVEIEPTPQSLIEKVYAPIVDFNYAISSKDVQSIIRPELWYSRETLFENLNDTDW